MSKKDSPAPPPAIDPVAVSQAQGSANKDTAIASARLNAVNSNSPFGSVSYSETPNANDPSVPNFTQNVTLSPDQQRLYDSQNGIMQQAYGTAGQALNTAQNTLSTPFSLNGLPDLQTGVNGGQIANSYDAVSPLFGIQPGGNIQNSVANAGNIQSGLQATGQQTSVAPAGNIQDRINMSNLTAVPLSANDFARQGQQTYDATMSRFNQDFPKQQEDVISRLNAQGIQQGSAGYGTAMDTLGRQQNDAMMQGVLAGNQEQNNLFNQSLASRGQVFGENQAQGNFVNAAQAQQYGQNLSSGQFTNQALQNLFGMNLSSMNANNSAQAQQYGQNLSDANFANSAQAQQFGQNQAQQQAYNQAAGQQTSQNQAQFQDYNTSQAQAFAQALQNAGLQNQGRQQSISEQQLVRSQPINEIATLLGLGGGIQTPNAAPNFGVNVGNTDVLGAYGLQQQGLQNNYNQQMQANNAVTGAIGGLFGNLGGAAMMKYSDRRLKNVIRRVGRTPEGIPVYLYSYRDRPQTRIVGVMAQDVRKVKPLAVYEVDGFLAVDFREVA